ncbi:hypothetical protein LINPERHAP1_LOCUS24769 [Linum perenne]
MMSNKHHSHPAISTSDSTSDPGSNPLPSTSTTNLDPWSFAVMIQKLATKSESVIDTYRRDLEELGSGLRKETAVICEVASRTVKDLPASLEASASGRNLPDLAPSSSRATSPPG